LRVGIEIPYEGTTLPGYFYRVKDNNNNTISTSTSRHTLIVHGGFDSTLEELYTSAAVPALERGYNCLTFEGPTISNQRIFDWLDETFAKTS